MLPMKDSCGHNYRRACPVWILGVSLVTCFFTEVDGQPTKKSPLIILNNDVLPKSERITALHNILAVKIVITGILCAALLDYFVYFLVRLYGLLRGGLAKDEITGKLFGFLVVSVFSLLRLICLPLMISLFPFSFTRYLPQKIILVSFWFNIISYLVLFNVPIVVSFFSSSRAGFRGQKTTKGIVLADGSGKVPDVVVVLPVYREDPSDILETLRTTVRSDYPIDKLHIVVAFDDETESAHYWALLIMLRVIEREDSQQQRRQLEQVLESTGASGSEIFLFPPRLDVSLEGVRVTICRFPHGGVASTKKRALQVVRNTYGKQASETFVLFMDSSIMLGQNTIYNLASSLTNAPKVTVVAGHNIPHLTHRTSSFYAAQNAVHFEQKSYTRTMDGFLGSLMDLPSSFAMVRLCEAERLSGKSAQCNEAVAVVKAPNSWHDLLKSRKKEWLSTLAQECYNITSPRRWRLHPFLLIFRVWRMSLGELNWLLPLVVVGVIEGALPMWLVYSFIPCFILRWLLLGTRASLYHQAKMLFWIPLFTLFAPLFNVIFSICATFSYSQRPYTQLPPCGFVSRTSEMRRQRAVSVNRSLVMITRLAESKIRTKRNPQLDSSSKLSSKLSEVFSTASVQIVVTFPFEVSILGGGDLFSSMLILPLKASTPLCSETLPEKATPSPKLIPEIEITEEVPRLLAARRASAPLLTDTPKQHRLNKARSTSHMFSLQMLESAPVITPISKTQLLSQSVGDYARTYFGADPLTPPSFLDQSLPRRIHRAPRRSLNTMTLLPTSQALTPGYLGDEDLPLDDELNSDNDTDAGFPSTLSERYRSTPSFIAVKRLK